MMAFNRRGTVLQYGGAKLHIKRKIESVKWGAISNIKQ